MGRLVLFDGAKCREYSPGTPLSALPLAKKTFYVEAEPGHYSTANVGEIRVGSRPGSHVRLGDAAAEFTVSGGKMYVGNDSELYLNGRKIGTGEHALGTGDAIWAGDTHLVVQEGYVSVTGGSHTCSLNISAHTPEKYAEFPIYKRSPRVVKRQPEGTVEIAAPRDRQEMKKGELARVALPPLMMMAVTVAMGVMLGRGLFVVASAAMLAVSLVVSITRFVGDTKDRREKERERRADYERYLLGKRKEIHDTHNMQKESLLYHNLSPAGIEREVMSYSSRLYERGVNDSDFLTVSLGRSSVATSYKLDCPADKGETVRDDLVAEMRAVAGAYRSLEDMPTVVDLKKAHLGLVGEKANIHKLLFSLLAQICFFQSYHETETIILVEETDREKFGWARWLPHCRVKAINITGLVSAENQRDQVLGNIARTLKHRRLKKDEGKKEGRFTPHYVFLIDSPKLIVNHSIMEHLQSPHAELGFSMVYATDTRANLPENIRTVFLLDGGDAGTLFMDEGTLVDRGVSLYPSGKTDYGNIARKLAPIRHSLGVSTSIPDKVTFFELYGVKRPEEIPVAELWEQNACHRTLAVPLGLRGRDDAVMLNLHEKDHGPHGLIAGTTGSGKSEILQSYILSLAVNFHPHEVGFLLIDYKGGGMSNLFAGLPHLLGTITNLDGSGTMRALASIRSELSRRQKLLGENSAGHINQYTKNFRSGGAKKPMPHLFIISDEFAELKKEQPDFISELVSAARIGRSLGVHLILATQKPTGVVDEQIWSNSRFKLALKVADEAGSMEILKTPDAARLTEPGRAYLQVGNNEVYELFQSAWSGAPYSLDEERRGFDSRIYLVNRLGQGELLNDDPDEAGMDGETGMTQLGAVVGRIREVYAGLGAAPVEKPWLEPLAETIVTPHINVGADVGLIGELSLFVPLGVADIPEEQLQAEYCHSFPEDGNLAVFGASGFGKSSLMTNVALSLASVNSPAYVHFFILDYGNSALAKLKGLPHTADYLTYDDAEKLAKLLKLLSGELKERKTLFAAKNATGFRMYNEMPGENLPAVLLFIDNYDVVRETGEELEEFLVRLTRDGTGAGMYTLISASRPGIVKYSVLNNFKNRLTFHMYDENDVTAVMGRCRYKLPEVKGRAMVKIREAHVAQCYLPAPHENDILHAGEVSAAIRSIAENNSARGPRGVRMVPEVVEYVDLEPYSDPDGKRVVIGFDTETTGPVFLDFGIPCHLVLGQPGTGKTNLLKLLAKQLGGRTLFVADSHSGDLGYLEDSDGVVYMGVESRFGYFHEKFRDAVECRESGLEPSGMKQREYCASLPPLLVLIDDCAYFSSMCRSRMSDMEKLIETAMNFGGVFVATATQAKLGVYDGIIRIFKDAHTGILFGNPQEQSKFQLPPGKKPVQAANKATVARRGEFTLVRLPFMG